MLPDRTAGVVHVVDRDFTVATIAAPRGGLGDADEEEETTDETEDKEETESDS